MSEQYVCSTTELLAWEMDQPQWPQKFSAKLPNEKLNSKKNRPDNLTNGSQPLHSIYKFLINSQGFWENTRSASNFEHNRNLISLNCSISDNPIDFILWWTIQETEYIRYPGNYSGRRHEYIEH